MNPKNSIFTRLKSILSDKNALWTVAFASLALLSVVLIFVVNPLILKLLFLLIAIGAAIYCWLLIESRRMTSKPTPKESSPPSPSETSEIAMKNETHETAETEGVTGEDNQTIEQDGHLVFVSNKGDKYHLDRKCAGLRFADNVEEMTEESAVSLKRKPCSKCGKKAK
jgi:hypothetical protein